MDINLYSELRKRSISPIDLARSLGVDKSIISRWNGRGIPPLRVLDVERVTGIPRTDLRPDLYPSGDGGPLASSSATGGEAA